MNARRASRERDEASAEGPFELAYVLRKELSYLGYDLPERENLRDLYNAIGKLPLSALCLSGGGIRSATFNLGLLQSLAKLGLLPRFDYLSSVSGGGYIAGWLKAWIHRKNTATVVDTLALPERLTADDPLRPEPDEIVHLRAFSNYLTPRVGLFSADTWAAAAMIVRNLILNWFVLIPALALMVAIPQAALIVATALRDCDVSPSVTAVRTAMGRPVLGLATLLAIGASVAIHHYRRKRTHPSGARTILLAGLAPLWLACAALSTAALMLCPERRNPYTILAFSFAWCLVIPLIGWLAALITTRRERQAPRWQADLLGLLLSGSVVSLIFYAGTRWWLPRLRADPPAFVILGVPILLGLYLLARSLFVAFASLGEARSPEAAVLDRDNADREWWARVSGYVLLAVAAWLAGSALVILGAALAGRLAHSITAAAGGILGLITSLLAAAPDTSGGQSTLAKPASRVKELLLRILAPATIACIVLLVAELSAWVGVRLVVILCASAWLLGWVVNVNRFSAHGLYRDRLIRAFLGASNSKRRADPFTGFDPSDNLMLHELAPANSEARPFLVMNGALNLVKDTRHLAWQQRKAEPFSMTALHCGNWHEGYRLSTEYGGPSGISLGTAMTISGAAANPSAGYHSSALVAFLMTLFNVRLGCWLANPNQQGDSAIRRSGPRHAWMSLFADLLGLTDSKHPYVNLSDGGHFENLGVYEMILRRCRFIVVSDAGRDPMHNYEDLGNLIRKVRIDFGISIRFDQGIRIVARDSQEGPGLICALGEIGYNDVDPGTPAGRILYLKPTLLTKGKPLPYDVYSYSRASRQFAHEPTSDQWFSEAQFESYRMLGRHLGEQLGKSRPFHDIPEFFDAVRDDLGGLSGTREGGIPPSAGG